VEFGVFDHLDRGDWALQDFYEARLRLVEAYDRAGFYAYHVAEHHSTPLGMAPSPSVFLSAVAQRTRRLRFGALVYALPLHHPLRLIEEICMLDQLSGGRLEIGFGRGSSAAEIAYYGQDPVKAQRIYAEALDLILQGLSRRRLDFHGQFFSFNDVPIELEPLQKPHPPLWYGVHSDESAERAARRGLNIVSLDTARETRSFSDRYRETWRSARGEIQQIPKIGLSRFIVVAPSDEEALSAARRAYPVWHRSFYYLFRLHGTAPAHPRPPEFDKIAERGQAIAGSPAAVAAFLRSQVAEAGVNYLLGQFAFGDLSLSESLRSIDLFTRLVIPELAGSAPKLEHRGSKKRQTTT
jgi:alkanesulfonate monooxygenase SsuD/methylene tetrahydromethanopterin reductase-like flavin-dependent oxidoreductase (luciferase family)